MWVRRLSLGLFFVAVVSAFASAQSLAVSLPQDISQFVQIEPGGFRLDHTTNEFVQRVRVRNKSRRTIAGSMVLLLDEVPAEIEVTNSEWPLRQGLASFITSPNAGALRAGKDLLPAGATADFIIRFKNPDHKRIRYKLRCFALQQSPPGSTD